MDEFGARAAAVRSTVAAAAARVGRDPISVTIIAVTKTFPLATVVAAVAAGFGDVGENYVQEARAKRAADSAATARWHLIGGLQRNKVRAAVATFDRLHTIDSIELAAAVATAATGRATPLPILLQVNIAADPAKRGVTPAAAETVAQKLLALPALALDGLMTIGPATDDPTETRAHFRALRQLRDDLARQLGVEMPELSMGMSDDYTIAVEEGATLIRVGRALFGDRPVL